MVTVSMVSCSRRHVGCWHDGGADQHVAEGASTLQSEMVSYCVVCNSTCLLLRVATDVGGIDIVHDRDQRGLCLTAITRWLKTESSLWRTVECDCDTPNIAKRSWGEEMKWLHGIPFNPNFECFPYLLRTRRRIITVTRAKPVRPNAMET